MSHRIVSINPLSDGDSSHRPRNDNHNVADEETYLVKLAHQWMQKLGKAEHGRCISQATSPRRPVNAPTKQACSCKALRCAVAYYTLSPGVNYKLDRLPDGYTVFGRPRPSNPSIVSET